MESKKGVSLIVLIITIIVMIILAGTIILSLNNTGIIKKAQGAVDVTNEKEVQQLVALLWAEAYMDETVETQEQFEAYVMAGLAKNNIDASSYAIRVTTKGASASLIPQEWRESVSNIVDGVPIPKGFVASSATGENTKNGGLVIYEGTEAVTDANVENAKRTRNQYVWVPVEDFSKFVRQNFGRVDQISNVLGTAFWEVVINTTTNSPDVERNKANPNYVTSTTKSGGITNTLAEVQAMYESVKGYKGFYIARYEAGLDIGSQKTSNDGTIVKTIHSKMNKAPYNYVAWSFNGGMSDDTNGAVEIARSIYPVTNSNYGVVSTLAYGVQWDRTIAWWVETRAQNGTKDKTISSNTDLQDSTLYGNYTNNAIPNSTFNTGASVSKDRGVTYTAIDSNYSKASTESHLLTTGATEETRVNNIYDMAGNVYEWTMEAYSTGWRSNRAGAFSSSGVNAPASMRYGNESILSANYLGFRVALYLK